MHFHTCAEPIPVEVLVVISVREFDPVLMILYCLYIEELLKPVGIDFGHSSRLHRKQADHIVGDGIIGQCLRMLSVIDNIIPADQRCFFIQFLIPVEFLIH